MISPPQCVKEGKAASEHGSHSAQESQKNRNVICAFNQHFKCSLLKRCGKCGGRPFCVSSDSSVARQMEPFLFIYF